MAPNEPSRLDRIEAILLQMAEQQQRTQQQLDQSHTEMRANIRDVVNMIDTVGTAVDNLANQITAMSAQIAADRAQAVADRAAEAVARAEFRSAMIGLQNETRNILRELAELRRQDHP